MEQIKIDLVPNGVMSVAHASQFDVGRSMKFLLTDEGVTYTLAGTEVITLKLRKPDGTDDTISLANTSSSYVEWTTVDGDLDLSGVYLAEITITSGDDVLGTANFLLKVEADPYDGKNVRTVTVGPADICTFETTLPEPLQSVIVDIEATGGNGTPENPIPINGYTEANITRCGVNLWDEEWEVGVIAPNGTIDSNPNFANRRTTSFIPVVPNTTYYLKCPHNALGGRYAYYNANKELVTYDGNGFGSPYITTPSNVYYIRMSIGTGYGTTYNHDISLNYPSTDTTYHPYTGNTYTIAFGQTVYGGVLDVTRGKLSVTHGINDLGDLSWTYDSSVPRFISNEILGLKNAINNDTKPNIICDVYKILAYNPFILSPENYSITNPIANTKISVRNTDYNDADDFKTNMTGHKIIYELATPFDIDLTPEVISAVVGTNNVFADCGETEVKYLKAGGVTWTEIL